jgi:hypothetical protein
MKRERYTKVGNYYVRRPQATRYEPHWTDTAKDVGEIVLGVVVLLALMFGIPFLLWLGASGV